ncbi:hypothetical protein LIPSTDRAFT_258798 [Lipomyces starkeyi NRRL Y-11557]|uniref:Uncharacterized protein n=1 Tax=Lipomyces starkeyi NRRL Y-11557 TaxID=675824 RepID=A0A1E3QAK9_LIPST|nr:hypothetical protein LIPSTDRAFT_258798 [Lipomyces starkeyi NRRL Y-11557]
MPSCFCLAPTLRLFYSDIFIFFKMRYQIVNNELFYQSGFIKSRRLHWQYIYV